MKKVLGLIVLIVLANAWYFLSSKEAIAPLQKMLKSPQKEQSPIPEIPVLRDIPEQAQRGIRKSLEPIPFEKRQEIIDRIQKNPLFLKNPHLIPDLIKLTSSIPFKPKEINYSVKVKAPQNIIDIYFAQLQNLTPVLQKNRLESLKVSDPNFKKYPDLALGVLQQLKAQNEKAAVQTAPANIVEFYSKKISKVSKNQQPFLLNEMRKNNPEQFNRWPALESQIWRKVNENPSIKK